MHLWRSWLKRRAVVLKKPCDICFGSAKHGIHITGFLMVHSAGRNLSSLNMLVKKENGGTHPTIAADGDALSIKGI